MKKLLQYILNHELWHLCKKCGDWFDWRNEGSQDGRYCDGCK